MSAPYRFSTAGFNDEVTNFRHTDEVQLIHSLKDVPAEYRTNKIKTEHDIYVTWRDFAKNALEGQYPEAPIPCWEGHYEQFGMVMLFLSRLAYNRSSEHMNDAFIDKFVHQKQYFFNGFWDASSTEERMWYRQWFNLIGHPDFSALRVDDIEGIKYSVITMHLLVATREFCRHLQKSD